MKNQLQLNKTVQEMEGNYYQLLRHFMTDVI